jgi:hypothetical protein
MACRFAPIGLDVVAGPARGERRRDHGAAVAQLGQLPIEAVASRAGLVTEMQPPTSVPLLQPGGEAAHAFGVGTDLAEAAHLAPPPVLGNRDGMPELGCIHAHEHFAMLLHGPLSCAEERPAPAGNPR